MQADFNFAALALLISAMAVYGFAVVASFSILRARVKRLREMEGPSSRSIARARYLVLHADRYLLSLQLAKFIGAVVSGAVAMGLAMQMLGVVENRDLIPAVTGVVAFIVGGGVLSLATFVAVQFAKSLAFSNPELTLCRVSGLVLTVGKLLHPLVGPVEYLVERALNALGMAPPVERETVKSAEEISEMVELGAEAGEIEQDELQMIEGVFRFSDTVVREVMTPRADIVHVKIDASLDEVRNLFMAEGISRLLVIGETLDDVKGIVMAKDLLPFVGRMTQDVSLSQFVRPVPIIPATKKVDELLQELRREAAHFAVVIDEHGGVDGIITIEDLLEEIVGEIFDEYDLPSAEITVRRTKGGDLLVQGSATIESLESAHGITIPRGEYDTLAGFVVHGFGRIPAIGEVLEHGALRIRVEDASPQRVTLLRILGSRNLGLRRVGVSRTVRHDRKKSIPSATLEKGALQDPPKQKVGISR